MSKSIEQLRQLRANPYYTLTQEEQEQLARAEAEADMLGDDYPKFTSPVGNAPVKEIGRLNKHSGDPVVADSAGLNETQVDNGAYRGGSL